MICATLRMPNSTLVVYPMVVILQLAFCGYCAIQKYSRIVPNEFWCFRIAIVVIVHASFSGYVLKDPVSVGHLHTDFFRAAIESILVRMLRLVPAMADAYHRLLHLLFVVPIRLYSLAHSPLL